MPNGLGETQKKIGRCLLDAHARAVPGDMYGLDAFALARHVYETDNPTQSQMNATWGAIRGLDKRGALVQAGRSVEGLRRWILTERGQKAFEALQPRRFTVVK